MAVVQAEAVWPTQQAAAAILGIDPSRLTRALDAGDVEWIESNKHVRPSALLRFAEQHQLSVVATAAKLLSHVAQSTDDSELEGLVADEVNGYLASYEERRRPDRRLTFAEFLEELRYALPARLLEEVAARLAASEAEPVALVSAGEPAESDGVD